jgi:flavin-dependent dehydrogenase
MVTVPTYDAVIIGGGPAGAAAGLLLASWGHAVRILQKPIDRLRGLGESVPPSTRKLLAATGLLDAVERAGFLKTTGNTVWWGSQNRRLESFEGPPGFQVFRPDFDDVLLDRAAAAGAGVCRTAFVRSVDLTHEPVRVEYDDDGARSRVLGRFVLDCSGRSGVLAKPHRRVEPSFRMYAMVGVWCRPGGWGLADDTHTLVETYEDGWAWSVPLSGTARHVGVMVDGTSPRVGSGRGLTAAYRAEIAKALQLSNVLQDADLQRVWACDAALYSSETYAGSRWLLVGDAGSFIDPLSSFGVKKALASAWLASVVVHTCLRYPERLTVALDFFSQWERNVYTTHLRRSCEFARDAFARHPNPFWARRAQTEADVPVTPSDEDLLRGSGVQAALERLRASPAIDLTMAEGLSIEKQPVIRGHEIVLDEALMVKGTGTSAATAGKTAPPAAPIRFLDHVDLLALARIACRHTRVPDVFEAYCRAERPVPLPKVLGALSFLVASGILKPRV